VRPSGAILVGGRSSRMGRDKARVELGGGRLAERLAAELAPLCAEVLLVGADAPEIRGCRRVGDAHPERSSLTGLYSALSAAAAPYVLVAACDYAFAGRRLFRALLCGARAGLSTLLPIGPDGPHPLLALHHRELAPRLRQRLDAGCFRVRAALDPLRTARLAWPSLRRLGVRPEELWNLNTPAELERARRFVEERDGHENQDGRADGE
jgi:molybdopterin-guanine dinucleotide biosynthesis protein A